MLFEASHGPGEPEDPEGSEGRRKSGRLPVGAAVVLRVHIPNIVILIYSPKYEPR